MSSKTKTKVNQNASVSKNDGSRWVVVDKDTHLPIYLYEGGVTLAQPEHFARGLVPNALLKQVV